MLHTYIIAYINALFWDIQGRLKIQKKSKKNIILLRDDLLTIIFFPPNQFLKVHDLSPHTRKQLYLKKLINSLVDSIYFFKLVTVPSDANGKETTCQCRRPKRWGFLGREDHLEEGMATYSVFSPGESHVQRSLVGYSPQGCKESDTTEAT